MGTHYVGTEEDVRALNAFIKLKRAMSSVQAVLQTQMTALGLTEGQFGALEALYHLGPMCQRALGEKLLTSGGNITMVVDNLEKRGLVRRERSAVDRRLIGVHLTDEGRTLIEQLFPQHLSQIVAVFSALEPDEQDELARLSKKLGLGIEHLSRRSGHKPGSPMVQE